MRTLKWASGVIKRAAGKIYCCCCSCTDTTTSYAVNIDGTPFAVSLIGACLWFGSPGPCGIGTEIVIFGDSCGWLMTVQIEGVWSVTSVSGPTGPTPAGTYTFNFDANCDLSTSVVTVS